MLRSIGIIIILAALLAVGAGPALGQSEYDWPAKVKEGAVREFHTGTATSEAPGHKWSLSVPSPYDSVAVAGTGVCTLSFHNTGNGYMTLFTKPAYANPDSVVLKFVYKIEAYPGVYLAYTDSALTIYKCAVTGTASATVTADTSWYMVRIPDNIPAKNYIVIARGQAGNAAGVKLTRTTRYRM